MKPLPPSSKQSKYAARLALALVVTVYMASAGGAALRDSIKLPRNARGGPAMLMAMDAVEAEDAAFDDDGGGAVQSRSHLKMARSSYRAAPPPMMAASGRAARAEDSLGSEVLNQATKPFDPNSVKTMLVREGSARIATAADVFKVADAAAKLAEEHGGFVEKRSDNGGYDTPAGKRGQEVRLTLRVPVAAYAAVLGAVRTSIGGLTSAAEVESSRDDVRDVTGQYVDAAARAATLEATRAQLQTLMTRADAVKDVLAVQRELASVTQQVEAKKAVMARLSRQASLSTLALTVRRRDPDEGPPPGRPSWSPIRTARRAGRRLLRTTQRAADVLVFALVFAAPPALLCLVIARCWPRAAARAWELLAPAAPHGEK